MRGFFLGLLIGLSFIAVPIVHADISENVIGRIILQVENKGEAWYVDPLTGLRSYLGRPSDAFKIMRSLGLGMTNKNIERIATQTQSVRDKSFSQKFAGRILLQTELSGEAWYVNPVDLKRYYLGRPEDSFRIMRELGLGISNKNLFRIPENKRFQSSESITSKRTSLSNHEIIKLVKPAITYIETDKGVGSGMIIDESGYILTNAHVLWDANTVKVKLTTGSEYTAQITGRDEIADLALIKIVGNKYPKVNMGDSDVVVQGDEVFALGYPFGLSGDVSFKDGTISRRLIDSNNNAYLETSTELHPGNSGGALVNKQGEVIGVNTLLYGQKIGGVTVGESIKLAIPINNVKKLIPLLKEGRTLIIEHQNVNKAQESTPSQEDLKNEFAIKAQCQTLGMNKKNKDDEEDSKTGLFSHGTPSYGYSKKLNTCIYGSIVIVFYFDDPYKPMMNAGNIIDLMTEELLWHSELWTKEVGDDSGKVKKFRSDFWSKYDWFTQ